MKVSGSKHTKINQHKSPELMLPKHKNLKGERDIRVPDEKVHRDPTCSARKEDAADLR